MTKHPNKLVLWAIVGSDGLPMARLGQGLTVWEQKNQAQYYLEQFHDDVRAGMRLVRLEGPIVWEVSKRERSTKSRRRSQQSTSK